MTNNNINLPKKAVCALIALIFVLTGFFVMRFCGIRINYLSIAGIRYVSDCSFGRRKSYNTDDDWFIIGRYHNIKDATPEYLRLVCMNNCTSNLSDKLEYLVFDSSKEAQAYFDNHYHRCTKYLSDDKHIEEGKNWFISRNPDVCDAVITSMYYLEDNVIIICNFPNKQTDWTPDILISMSASGFIPTYENILLKEYVISNAHSLADYAIDDILCNQYSTLYRFAIVKNIFVALTDIESKLDSIF